MSLCALGHHSRPSICHCVAAYTCSMHSFNARLLGSGVKKQDESDMMPACKKL